MPDAPDLILTGGTVRTLDDDVPIADTVAITNGRISAVGPATDLSGHAGPTTRTIDLAGRTVIPGFYDGHPHMDREGLKLHGGRRMQGLGSVSDILDAVRQEAEATPNGDWVVCMPMELLPADNKERYVRDPGDLIEGRFPTRADLDAVAPDHPVIVRGVWGWWSNPPFPCVVNSRALEIAGIDRDTKAPHNATIATDPSGEPSGVLLENNRTPILEHTLLRCVPKFTYSDRLAAARESGSLYNAVGTSSGYEAHGLTPLLIDAYAEAAAEGALSVRLTAPLSLPTAAQDDTTLAGMLDDWAPRLAGQPAADGLFRTNGICLDFGDPAVAALAAGNYPYEQWGGHFPQALDETRFAALCRMAAERDIRVNTLACYDLEMLLRTFETIDRDIPIRDKRWVIFHLIEATDDQLSRIRDLGLAVTVLPNLLYESQSRFGLDKLGDRAVPIRRLLDAGIPTALSSDNVPIPMGWAMWTALERWDSESQSHIGDSELTRDEALALATRAGPWLSFDETRRGVLKPGYDADLAVLDEDPATCDVSTLRDLSVAATFVGGDCVYAQRGAPFGGPTG